MHNFAGRWLTRFGPMTLSQSGATVEGTYGQKGMPNRIGGTVQGNRLEFDYTEHVESGSGGFELTRDGRFVGEYRAAGKSHVMPWHGNRHFDGIWNTTLGLVRIVQDGNSVVGLVSGQGNVQFEGAIDGDRLHISGFVNGPAGDGYLEVDAELMEMRGTWRPVGGSEGGSEHVELHGVRALPQGRHVWLVVLEAHWQRSLADAEFAFGHMLQEVFARLPHVGVRHRFFDGEASLLHWCRELLFLPEPVVLVITSHGETGGLSVLGKIIDTKPVVDALQLADSLQLMHFSCCLIAHEGNAGLVNAGFPVSGYTRSVDWIASALIEFTYLDMILGKGLTPGEAAEQVVNLIGFAGKEVPDGCPYPAADFRYLARSGHAAATAGGATRSAAEGATMLGLASTSSTAGRLDGWQALRRLIGLR